MPEAIQRPAVGTKYAIVTERDAEGNGADHYFQAGTLVEVVEPDSAVEPHLFLVLSEAGLDQVVDFGDVVAYCG